MNNYPKVSIITATYNSEVTIECTLNSILNQTYKNIELIIVDGASSDETLTIVERYKNKFSELNIEVKMISEIDKGIGDAWNKGLSISTGEIISFLNSDDYYENEAVQKAVNILNTNEPEISYGVCVRIDKKNNITKIIRNENDFSKIYRGFKFSHTTCFNTRKAFEKVGNFNIKYKIAIDADFLMRAYKEECKFKKCNNITYMREDGISNKYVIKAKKEYYSALIANDFGKVRATKGYIMSVVIYLINKYYKKVMKS